MSSYLEKMNEIQNILLQYIDEEDNTQEKYQNFVKLFTNHKIFENKHLLTSVIHLLASIIDYHYRKINFFDKIFKIILFLKDEIKKNYSNLEIFNFFKSNKKVILFLSQEKIITFDKLIVSKLCNDDGISETNMYFYPEIKGFLDDNCDLPIDNTDNIETLRKTEYSEYRLIQLIQNDLFDEFLSYINANNFDLSKSIIRSSLSETNLFIIQEIDYAKTMNDDNLYPKPIDYAAFFGSLKIFNYLLSKNCSMEPRIWLYAIHGRNKDIIHVIESNSIQPESAIECLNFSIDCYHNELSSYILSNYIGNDKESLNISKMSLESYNFDLIQPKEINSDTFFTLCKKDYFYLANAVLLSDKNVINLRSKSESENPNPSEKTPLYIACKKGNFEIVQLLVENEAIDVNMKSIKKMSSEKRELTPLYAAIKSGNMKIVQLLLDHKNIDINMKSIFGKSQLTPLYSAIESNYIDIVRLLIERKDIDINIKSLEFEVDYDEYTTEYYKEITPLYTAIELKKFEIVKLLLENKNIYINAPVNIRIERQRDFDEERLETSIKEETALYKAVSDHSNEIVKLLLSQEKINVNASLKMTENNELVCEKTVLQRAVDDKNHEIAKLLLNNKSIDVNAKLMDPPTKPEKDIWDQHEIENIKVSNKEHFDEAGYSAISTRHIDEKTLLSIAVDNDDVEMVSILLGNENIDINAKSTMKHYKHFINDKGEEEEEKKHEMFTPLYFAVEKENVQIVQLLVNHKNIDVNLKSTFYLWTCKKEEKTIDKEETALHNAVSKGNLDIIKLLLGNKSIDINIVDKQGKKPIELSNKKEVISLFNH
ncbi:hypothetical protein M9Y10_032510 [Tritrichomonas musculus]|uniref:DUF3447 domain-containing protein n=1 Tax=Tritrichomonas musculus TaxID=1915356 RepID=A0ABR2GYN1_9EUKA